MRKLYWHIHHDILVEEVTDSIEKRIDFIKTQKSDADLRLRLLKPVGNQELIDSAFAKYEKIKQDAWVEYDKIKESALVEYKKTEKPAWCEYEKIKQSALEEYEKTIRELHVSECPKCPWKNTRIQVL